MHSICHSFLLTVTSSIFFSTKIKADEKRKYQVRVK
uniref:Uncharacterized protein n=1 Tax=Arundo donax TaxID=35708 RepID=A0A0A9H976_ARUDO